MDNDSSKETGRQPEQKSTTEKINDFLNRHDKSLREFFSENKPNLIMTNTVTVALLAALMWPNASADLSLGQEFLKSLTASMALGHLALVNLQPKDSSEENK